MSLPKPLIERVVVSKYLLRRARETLASSSPFVSGLTVLQLHDATEMLLRVVAEHLHTQIKERSSFDQIVNAVASVATTPLKHRSALNQLNKARVNFKHFGLEPKKEDAQKLLLDMESFYPETVKTLLREDFDAISLSSLAGHRRTENWLAKAETALESGEYDEAVRASTVAFEIYRHHLKRDPDYFFALHGIDRLVDSELQELIDEIKKKLLEHQSQLDFIMDGINLAEYRRFLRYAPHVMMTGANTLYIQSSLGQKLEIDQDEAAFCCRFVLDAILTMKENHVPPRWGYAPEPDGKLRVTEDCSIIVFPQENPEVIREARKGETLLRYKKRRPRDGHLVIVEEGDKAYVPETAVETID